MESSLWRQTYILKSKLVDSKLVESKLVPGESYFLQTYLGHCVGLKCGWKFVPMEWRTRGFL